MAWRIPQWIDRLWLWIIGIAFVLFVPLWIALWFSRSALLGIAVLLTIGIPTWRYIKSGFGGS